MPQFAVLIYADDSERAPGAVPNEQALNDEHARVLAESGAMRAAYALTPRSMAVSITADGEKQGTFLDAPQVVVGYYILEAADLDAAVAIARTNPAVSTATGGVEVRPVHSGGPVEG